MPFPVGLSRLKNAVDTEVFQDRQLVQPLSTLLTTLLDTTRLKAMVRHAAPGRREDLLSRLLLTLSRNASSAGRVPHTADQVASNALHSWLYRSCRQCLSSVKCRLYALRSESLPWEEAWPGWSG